MTAHVFKACLPPPAIAIIVYLATKGILMVALPMWLVLGVLLDAILYAFVLDSIKVMLFDWLNMEY